VKKLALVALLVCALPLASCADKGVPIVNGQTVSQSAPEVFINAEKALTVAHLAYNAISGQILQATQAGILKGSTATEVKNIYDKAGDALNVADTADRAGNTTNLLAAIQDANSAIAQVKSMIGVK